ncbi:uncharacterized protein LOC143284689 isoform X2 [Babylonia areolata]|uniref:uncharacterized protein LOC143284689 isoform X2 n=1 Tax=Babylonia areolata TaxID=304850 RepID=UPI003FD01CDE
MMKQSKTEAMERPNLRKTQIFIFGLGWLAYASTYLLRKPLGVIKADMESELSFTKSQLGWLDAALLLPYAVMQMVLGPLGDKFGARRTLGCCLMLSAVSMLSFGYWSNLYMFCIFLFLNGTAQSQCWPNVTKVVISWFSDEVINTVFGMLGTSIFGGGVLATVVAVFLEVNYGWRSTHFFPALFVFGMGAIVLMFYQSSDESGPNTNGKKSVKSGQTGEVVTMWELWKIPMVMESALGMFCLKVVRYCMYMWLPMYLLQQLNYPQSTAGMLSTTFEIGGVVGTALIGLVIDRVFNGRSMLGTGLSMLSSSVALILFTLTGTWGMFFNIIFLFLAGAFNAGPDSILGGAIPAEIAQKDGRNAAGAMIGFVNGFGSLGSCLEGPLVGFISTYYGWGSVIYLMTGLSALGALAVFRAARVNTKMPQIPEGPTV